MSDRIVVMRAGAIEQIADPKTLFESPRTAFAARFMGVENVLEGRLESVVAGRPAVRVGDHLLHGRPVGDVAAAQPGSRVFAAIRAEHMRFADPGSTGPNRLAGTPGTAIYKGKFRDIPFSSAVGTVVVRQWDTDRDLPVSGEVEFNADNCVVGVLEQDDVA